MPLEITTNTFEDLVLKADKPVLVDFWAVWCGPCRQVGPVVDRLAKDYDGKLTVGKVNVDEQTELAERYRVMSIPTLYVFKAGEVVDKLVGARPYNDLKVILDKYVD
ncbi:MAG TPA: thioredoxin [Clostridiaceae bacterium]|jgi:thioredoxin 1|nr:thioredoxin [Clostridiaceae bacterium]